MTSRHLAVADSEGQGATVLALPGSRRAYEDLVTDGRRAAKSQWVLGDLANEVGISYGQGRLQRYARDIGIPYKTLKEYRTVARAYKKAERSARHPWSVFQVLTSQADRLKLIEQEDMTTTKAKEIRADRNEGKPARGRPAAAASREKAKAKRAEDKASKDRIHENAYSTMAAAPAGAQNNPMFWRASKVEALINELRNLDPEVAAGQLLSPAPRFFTAENLDWWTRFVTACVKRAEEEGLKRVQREPSQALWAESGLDVRGAGG